MRLAPLLIALLLTNSCAKTKHNEDFYNKRFCASKHGKSEVIYRKDHIRTDCEYQNYVCETDWAKKIFEGVGQSIYYSHVTGKKPCLVIIEKNYKDHLKVKRMKPFIKKMGIKLHIIKAK